MKELLVFPKYLMKVLGGFRRSSLTLQFPYIQKQIPANSRNSFRFDVLKCTACEDCEKICPTKAISMSFVPSYDGTQSQQLRDVQQLSLDFGKCINCGWCVDVCEPQALTLAKARSPVVIQRENLVQGLIKLKTLPKR